MTPQRVLVLWRNTEGGQGRQQGDRKGRQQQEEGEGRQGGEEKEGGQGEGTPLSQSTARSVGAPALQ